MAKKHSSEACYALDDSLEVAVFSVLAEMIKLVRQTPLESILRKLKERY